MSFSTKSLTTQGLLLVIGLLTVLVILLMTRPAAPQAIPVILDEHGNNLVYQCPGDARCDATPFPWSTPYAVHAWTP